MNLAQIEKLAQKIHKYTLPRLKGDIINMYGSQPEEILPKERKVKK